MVARKAGMPTDSETRRTDPKYDNLSDLLLDSPFAGANLDLEPG
jgi:hypothetical protein